ncbi:hypothetical protein [Qipengyuania sp. MTN3-11]|uniref:hypothetical protein n=1 Tax=Qipengyuania sp. MTN3-11 TaxID=3056557 RepID=UPI0036F3E3D6
MTSKPQTAEGLLPVTQADPRTNNIATGIIGSRVGEQPTDESEHFLQCEECGEAFDCRDLGQVFHHHEPGHRPLGES